MRERVCEKLQGGIRVVQCSRGRDTEVGVGGWIWWVGSGLLLG